jgi:hypothetical protein
MLLFHLDAIHNFHPQYRDYTQYSAKVINDIHSSEQSIIVISFVNLDIETDRHSRTDSFTFHRVKSKLW